MPSSAFADRGVAVLGGTAGVGLETASQFVEQGARVVILGRNDARGAAACEKVRERGAGGEVGFVRVDATDPDGTLRAEAECRAALGSIDVLVNTTGPSDHPRLLHTIPIQSIQQRITEIILPPVHMMHAALPAMRGNGSGSIINVASDAAKVATPGETLVGAAMAAIVMYSKAAALEVKREGIRINVLTPSLIADTPGAALIASDPFSAKLFEKAAAMAHLGVALPADLAAMTLFLASDSASKITGQTISVNGGISVG
ncbi:SDR family oxidoreductase [Mycolicibacterium sp.]|uniref:SDR family NAD(P)-dependent oxidoreductase n=1 Tax=Mycolicibacterium sp. TaxID=2320850 RepID=UPI001A217ABC|nr:SDR family oxidoreductase [Mycolicibacterium sp.]MBJ7337541.1 SDR family oxidoreductase [Mycolicibacterium sp.]